MPIFQYPLISVGGCCPGGYQCATNGCIPSAGFTSTQTCGVNSYLCPASLNYGCCQSGLGCALSSCYATSVSTFTLTRTLTTTDAALSPHTLTTTVVSSTVLGAPDATETADSNGIVGKFTPSPTASEKIKASGSEDTGLTTPEIGGIIGGAVAILLVVFLAAYFIIKRLNRAIRISEANSRTRSSSSGQRTRRSMARNQDIDAMSVDPLMMTASETSGTIRRPHGSANPTSSTTYHEVEANSPPSFTSPFSPRSPPYTLYQYQKGYNPISGSESQYSSASSGIGGYRNPAGSVESTPPMHHNPNAGYFDLPLHTQPQTQNREHRTSQVSQLSPQSQAQIQTGFPRRPSQHGRHWSDASDISQVSQTSLESAAELDAGRDGRRRSSGLSGNLNFARAALGRMVSRRRSEPVPVPLSGGPVRSPDLIGSPREGLWHIPEAGESTVRLDPGEGISNAQFREISLLESEGGTFGVGRRGLGMSMSGGHGERGEHDDWFEGDLGTRR